jgi:hypothetical protein
VQKKLTETVGDIVKQLPLLSQKRTLIGCGHFFAVANTDRAFDFFVDPDRRVDYPRCLFATGGVEDVVVISNPGMANLRILPSVGDYLNDPIEHIVDREFRFVRELNDLVQAVEFLCPFFQIFEQSVEWYVFAFH